MRCLKLFLLLLMLLIANPDVVFPDNEQWIKSLEGITPKSKRVEIDSPFLWKIKIVNIDVDHKTKKEINRSIFYSNCLQCCGPYYYQFDYGKKINTRKKMSNWNYDIIENNYIGLKCKLYSEGKFSNFPIENKTVSFYKENVGVKCVAPPNNTQITLQEASCTYKPNSQNSNDSDDVIYSWHPNAVHNKNSSIYPMLMISIECETALHDVKMKLMKRHKRENKSATKK